jgi:hypothetical protein
MPEKLDDNFLNHANDVKLKAEDSIDFAKAAVKQQLESNKNKGLGYTSIATMAVIGIIIFIVTILLYATDFQGGSFSSVFNLYKVAVSVIMLILSMVGYVIFGTHGVLSYRSSVKYREKIKDRYAEVKKIIDIKHFKTYKNNISYRNKINKLRDVIDLNTRERYGINKFFFRIKNKIFDITGKWEDIRTQLEAYIRWTKIDDVESEKSLEQKKIMGNFNLNNFKLDYREWKDNYFVSGSSSSIREDNSSLERNTLKKTAIRKGRSKFLIWIFLTIVTSFSVTSMMELGTRDKLSLGIQLLFVVMTCLSGYKDSYETEEEDDESAKDLQTDFAKEYNSEYEKIKEDLIQKEKKDLDQAHYYAIEENKSRDKGEFDKKETSVKDKTVDTGISDLRDYCKDCLKLSKMCSGYALNDYKAPQTCDKRETNDGKVVKKDVRPMTFLERQKMESEK